VLGNRHRGRRGDPSEVEIRVIREPSRIVICTIYPRNERWGHRDDDERRDDACERAQQRGPRSEEENDTRIDYEVRVPEGVNFVGQTITADVALTGLRANAEGYSIAGNVTISDVKAIVVDAASISGDISFNQVDAAQVYAGTLSGDVSFDGAVRRGGDYGFLSYTGELTVNLPPRAGVSLSVRSPRESITSSVPLSPPTPESKRRFAGKQGDGGAQMSVTTFNGEVIIRPAE
jgi:hypothetical protein